MHQINHEARINPDLFAAGRLTMHACIKHPSVTTYAVHAVAVCASTTQWLLSLATPRTWPGWLRGAAAAYPEPR